MSAGVADWARLQLPLALPPLELTPDSMQIFMFSAATWNRHHIHYSKDAALAEGLPDVVVQRALIGNFFARLLSGWLGDSGAIRELSWKVTASALPNRTLRVHGAALRWSGSPGQSDIECELHMDDADGRTIATGRARLCRQSGPPPHWA